MPNSNFRPLLHRSIATLLLTSTLTGAQSPSVTSGTADREKIRRQDYIRRGENALTAGDVALRDKNFERATAFYKSACDLVPNAPKSQELHDRALSKFCDASCQLAEQQITEGRYGDAEATLRIVLDERYNPLCKQAILILARLEQPDYYNKTITPEFRANIERVKQLFLEAQGFYVASRFDLAKKRCEQILNIDRNNIAARKLEEQIGRKVSEYAAAAYNETRASALKDIDRAWERPVRRFNLPDRQMIASDPTSPGGSERINRKLDHIIVPRLEFREATIREAVDFLKKKSAELDADSPGGEKGVNIVLKLDAAGSGAPTPMPPASSPAVAGIPGLDPIPAPSAPAPLTSPVAISNPADARITVSLINIPLREALKYVTSLANLKFKVEPYAVSVVPMSENTETLITKEWHIPPDLIPRSNGAGAGAAGAALSAPAFQSGGSRTDASKGGSGITDRESAKNWLIENGVTFNGQASAVYIVRSSRLIVRNTQDQLDLIDTIISTGGQGQGPAQVEIEAKFVEISQNNLKELSFDWTLGAFNMGSSQSVFGAGGTSGTSQAISSSDYPLSNSDGSAVGTNPVTAGNRSGSNGITSNAIDTLLNGTTGNSSKAPGIASIAGVFTDPQFQMVIRALNQKKGVDLLSAPRVTTKSGQRAVIEIIREFRYPTEFDPPQIPQTFGGSSGTGTGTTTVSSFPVTPTTPTAFETRNTGVTLEVEPIVGPDGYTIDLNLVPQVVEFEGFINYGSPITTQDSSGNSQVVTPNVINQPIFSTRKVTTSVSVFDGSTIMLGGLIREDVQKVEDKVPIIGDIPILGRLFRSSIDQHLKRNLVIFVSTKLINPAGDPIRRDDETEEIVEITPPARSTAPVTLPHFPK